MRNAILNLVITLIMTMLAKAGLVSALLMTKTASCDANIKPYRQISVSNEGILAYGSYFFNAKTYKNT